MLFAASPISYLYERRRPESSSTAWKKGGYILGLELTDPFAADLWLYPPVWLLEVKSTSVFVVLLF